jgi:hypothetical protein
MKLTPMLKGTTALQISFRRSRATARLGSLQGTHVDGLGAILISGANSPSSLSQVTMRRQVQDDLSKWEMNAAGDPEIQADNRSRAHEFAKILKLDAAGAAGLPDHQELRGRQPGAALRPVSALRADMQVLEWENMLAALDPEHPEPRTSPASAAAA